MLSDSDWQNTCPCGYTCRCVSTTIQWKCPSRRYITYQAMQLAEDIYRSHIACSIGYLDSFMSSTISNHLFLRVFHGPN